MFGRLYRLTYRYVVEMRWSVLALLGAGHFSVSWALAALVDPSAISSADVFWYYYLVTATTVGYGDFAPTTVWSRLIAVLWIMPGAIALFTAAIAKAAQAMAESWRRNMRGGGDFSKLDGHIVLIGWRGERSERLIDQLADAIGQSSPEIVVVSDRLSQNPAPDRAHFVRAETMSDPKAFVRAGLGHAAAAVVMAETDADALAGSLAAAAEAPDLRIVAYFQDERMAELLKAHCPFAETAPSLSIELLARAARDAGSAELLFELASSQEGPTEFSLIVPEGVEGVTLGAAFVAFKRDYDATLLGVRGEGERNARLNPRWTRPILPGDRIYYVADGRLALGAVDWAAIA